MDGTFETQTKTTLYERMTGMAHSMPQPQEPRSGGFAEKIAQYSILLLFFLLPFFFVPAAWIAVPQAKALLLAAAVVVAVLAWVAAALSAGSLRVPRSFLLYAALLIPVAYLLSALTTGGSGTSFVGGGAQQDTVVAVAMWYALLVVCASVLSANPTKLVSAIRMLLAGGAVVLLIQAIRLVFPSFTFGGVLVSQVSSVIGSWHDLGIFLGLMFFLSLALFQTSVAKGWWKWLLIEVAVVSGLFLIVLNFRDVWLALTILSAAYAAYVWFGSRGAPEIGGSARSRRPFLWLAVAVAALGFYFGGTFVQGVLPAPLQVTQIEVRPSWQGTFTVGSSRVFSEPTSIFFGSGPNTFPREWGMYKPLSVNATQFWNIDFYSGVGFIPTSFVTVGLLGVLAWGAVCIALLFSVWNVMRRRGRDGELSVLHAALVAGAVYLAAFHILYVPGPALSALLFLVFGVMIASHVLAGFSQVRMWPMTLDSWKGQVSVGALVIVGLVFFFGEVQSVRALVSDMLVNRAVVVYNTTQDFAKASQQTSAALAIQSKNDRAHRAAIELGLLQLAQMSASGDTSEEAQLQLQTTLNETIQHGLTAVAIESTNYQNWLSLARLYGELAGAGVEGAEAQARAAYEEAKKNNPTNPLPFLGIAQIDLQKGDDAAARLNLTAALEIKPDLVAAIFLLSQIDARANDLQAAAEKAAAVVTIAPEDPLGWYNFGTILYAGADYQNAAAAFERAVGLQNEYANALFLLGASYAELGRFEEAALALRAVVSLDPSQEAVQSMITELEVGRNPFRETAEEEEGEE